MIPIPTWALEDVELVALREKIIAVMADSDDGDYDGRADAALTAIEDELDKRGMLVKLV